MMTISYLHLNLSISLPAHSVAKATFMEKTRIFPTLSLQREDEEVGKNLFIVLTKKNTYLCTVAYAANNQLSNKLEQTSTCACCVGGARLFKL